MDSDVPPLRVRDGHDSPHDVRGDGEFVLYWMTSFRRPRWNFALDRAVEWRRELGLPLVVFEPLRVDYRWASDRFHRFAIEGMRDNAEAFAGVGTVAYYPYVESKVGSLKKLFKALVGRAAVVVTDDYPGFFVRAMNRAASRVIDCPYELVDSNGLYPMRACDKVWSRAYDFRRHLQKNVLQHLGDAPKPAPLQGDRGPSADGVLDGFQQKWNPVSQKDLNDPSELIASLPIDHDVPPVQSERGGWKAAGECLDRFINDRLDRYEDRNDPEADSASGLSSYLHWGHVSPHEVFDRVAERESWSPKKTADKANGSSDGWWGMSPEAEGFMDELLTWRELGLNMSSKRTNYTRFESLPDWAKKSLAEHSNDQRPHTYSLDEFEHAETHDDLWNAAQRQLLRDGRIHNYLRMLWGKKVLHWSESPREAYEILEHLNNKYALDGRDPNSYSGILWIFGRYDRAWGPEREIFGKIRYMTSDNTKRKVHVKDYLKRYAADSERSLF